MSEERNIEHTETAKQAETRTQNELQVLSSREFKHAKLAIRNFDLVTPWFFRGGQPGKEGIQALADLGVKTVVSLRWSRKLVEAERAAVETAGMKFVSIPLNYWNTPTPKIIDEFFDLIHEPANRPVFLHCFHGADRTGLLVAMYRITHQEWHFERAYQDMKAHGFHRFRIRNFKWVLWRYAARHPSQAHLWWFTGL